MYSELAVESRPKNIAQLTLTIGMTVMLVACADRNVPPGAGVSWDLARHRARTLSNIHYALEFRIPEAIDQPIDARASISFTLTEPVNPLILDFNAPEGHLLSVAANGRPVPHVLTNGHLSISGTALESRDHTIDIEFVAGDMSLNRNREFLYTLFVPDRASTAFPSFDQPNLKARYQLTVETPIDWHAVANARRQSADTIDQRVRHRFGETTPISTYLFAFAAGKFMVESGTRAGRSMHMYHRETDRDKVQRNRETIFDLHAAALAWLEQYTGIPYPFDKFDFVLVPAFQYGGMEHPGAVLYRASSLLLDESATQNQLLGRASLIAHETAHMWFGDLVTMNWFDDVWTKEVFANFMAAKIVNPSFPDIDHDLRFFLGHYPSAYDVDRTAGANPIRQPLDNLKDAGTLYGAIIYQKAPVVMRHLERMIGFETFRNGMRQYLSAYRFANATWPDLIAILDERTAQDLSAWSQTWVEEPNRPTVAIDLSIDADQSIESLVVVQSDPAGRGRTWDQELAVTLGWGDSSWTAAAQLESGTVEVPSARGLPKPDYALLAADGVGYGFFQLDEGSKRYLLQNLPRIQDASVRSVGWVTLWDAMLDGSVAPERLATALLEGLPREPDELIVQRMLGYLSDMYWRYLSPLERAAHGPEIEQILWRQIERAPTASLKAAFFRPLVSVALTDSSLRRLEDVWRQRIVIPGLPLSERDFTSLALELAVREVDNASEILETQSERIENPDRAAEFSFILPALSPNPAVRDAFFESMKDAKNREHEPWVLRGLRYVHHPLRAQHAERYLLPSLELLEEIQQTGDIFFPKRWLDATLSGHNSPAAAQVVRTFLNQRDRYPERLRLKILQSADPVFRSSTIVYGT